MTRIKDTYVFLRAGSILLAFIRQQSFVEKSVKSNFAMIVGTYKECRITVYGCIICLQSDTDIIPYSRT